MQNLINEAPQKKNYDFIDAIRGIGMIAIVVEHSISAGGYSFELGSPKYWAYIILMQLFKFGTITFFLLAGFLISEKFTDYSPAQYLKRRISTTFGPWIFWSLLYVVASIVSLKVLDNIYHDGRFNLTNIIEKFKITYLYSNYWFIINFLVSISILLIFRKYLYSFIFGSILGAFSLFYAVNIHYEWVDPNHTTAILGFVFFLWLGAQMRKNFDSIEQYIAKLSYPLIWLLMAVTFAVAIYEIVALHDISLDPLNTLRFSNMLYTVACFALLLKVKTFKVISYIKPRQTTYGIYLIHYIIIVFLLPEIFIHFHIDGYALSVPQYLLFKVITFILAYGITLLLVMLIANSKAKKLVGN